jgi:hypothetical protein
MTVHEEAAKQCAMEAVKVLFDEGKLTLEEIHRHLGVDAIVFGGDSSRSWPMSIKVILNRRPDRL